MDTTHLSDVNVQLLDDWHGKLLYDLISQEDDERTLKVALVYNDKNGVLRDKWNVRGGRGGGGGTGECIRARLCFRGDWSAPVVGIAATGPESEPWNLKDLEQVVKMDCATLGSVFSADPDACVRTYQRSARGGDDHDAPVIARLRRCIRRGHPVQKYLHALAEMFLHTVEHPDTRCYVCGAFKRADGCRLMRPCDRELCRYVHARVPPVPDVRPLIASPSALRVASLLCLAAKKKAMTSSSAWSSGVSCTGKNAEAAEMCRMFHLHSLMLYIRRYLSRCSGALGAADDREQPDLVKYVEEFLEVNAHALVEATLWRVSESLAVSLKPGESVPVEDAGHIRLDAYRIIGSQPESADDTDTVFLAIPMAQLYDVLLRGRLPEGRAAVHRHVKPVFRSLSYTPEDTVIVGCTPPTATARGDDDKDSDDTERESLSGFETDTEKLRLRLLLLHPSLDEIDGS